jgi:hypothetical protein
MIKVSAFMVIVLSVRCPGAAQEEKDVPDILITLQNGRTIAGTI